MRDLKSGFGKIRQMQEIKNKSSNKKSMQMVFWNIRGINGLDEEDWETLKKNDIINVSETWIDNEKDTRIAKRLQDYEVKEIKAKKENRKGRPKGEMVTAYRNNLQDKNIRTQKINEELLKVNVKIETEEFVIISVYIREKRKENYEKMVKIIEENKEKPIFIGGDFNARTAR